jgi:iron complex outermembrane recepter protein
MIRIASTVLLCCVILFTPAVHAAATAAAASADVLAEITVTAEKTTQRLQKTAAAITAISSDTMIDAGVDDLRQAQKLVPAVRFQAEDATTQVFIRGVGANLDFPNVQPNVAFNFAGNYMPREATSAAFFDVAQLEVLPGTQGGLGSAGIWVKNMTNRAVIAATATAYLEDPRTFGAMFSVKY